METVNLDALEQRLSNLDLESPDDRLVTARVLARAPKPKRSPIVRVLAIGIATVLVAGGVLYFVPAAGVALADAPIAGPLLHDAGLVGAGNHVTSVGAGATSSGYRLVLVGAYADSSRTVLLLQANPAILPLGGRGGDVELTDQFGRSYRMQSGRTDTRTGQVIAQFEPLAWPDGLTGARITLKITAVQGACRSAAFCTDPVADGDVVQGSWTLPAILGLDEGTALRLPATAHAGAAVFQFTSIRSSSATIGIDIAVTGATFDDLQQRFPDGGKGTPAFTIELFAPDGNVANDSYSIGEDQRGLVIHFLGYRSGSGDYRLHISYRGSDVDIVLTIP